MATFLKSEMTEDTLCLSLMHYTTAGDLINLYWPIPLQMVVCGHACAVCTALAV